MTALATTTLETAAPRWDAIVIGAGPAGAMAARGLAQRQMKALLVDRKDFPRSKVCGCCLSHRALLLLEQAGLGSRIQQLHGVPLEVVQLVMNSRTLRIPLPGGVSISREELDEMLVQAAIMSGADFLPHATAQVLPKDSRDESPFRSVELTDPAGRRVRLEAPVIIAADGLGHPSLRQCPEFVDHVPKRARMGLGATLSTSAAGFDFGTITMTIGRFGYVGAVRLRDGRLHLAASVDPRALEETHRPADLVARILNDNHSPLVTELHEAQWQGTLPLSRRSAHIAYGRIFLIGDAAGYVEPFTGEGMAWALATGLAVPSFAKRAVNGNYEQAERGWQAWHGQMIRRRQGWCRVLAQVLRSPTVAATAMRLMSFAPALPRFVIHRMNRPLLLTESDCA